MILFADFLDICGQLNHINVTKYLKYLNWSEFAGNKNPNVKVFQITNQSEFEQVEVPIRKDLSDYNQAMLEVVKTLSKVEKRNIEDVILNLLNPMSDILQFRIKNDSVQYGSILLEDAFKLFENSKKLLASAAMDIASPKVYHQGRILDSVQKFIDSCRFGQTEIGSYVVNLVCPLGEQKQENFEQLSLFSDKSAEQSFTRKVINKLMTNLVNLKDAINSGQDLNELLNVSHENFVSINYLDALKNIGIEDKNTELDIHVKWAPTVYDNRCPNSFVAITNDYYEIINEKVTGFKEHIEKNIEQYVGKISDCKSNPDLDKRDKGTVILKYINNNKATSIKAELNKEDYDKAVIAHKNGQNVKVTGEKKDKNHIINCSLDVL